MIKRSTAACALLVLLALLGSCSGATTSEPKRFPANAYPERLSQWNLLHQRGESLVLGQDVRVYDINMPLFSDYAGKLRTLWLPSNTQLSARADGQPGFDYPVGAIISKTFFYQRAANTGAPGNLRNVAKTSTFRSDGGALALADYQPIETRLMVNHEDGWHAVSYQWRGTDAYLAITGAIVPLRLQQADGHKDFSYLIPSRNQCAGCHATNHTTGKLVPIGLHKAQLQRPAPGNHKMAQLEVWQEQGWIDAELAVATSAMPSWEQASNGSSDPAASARAYLDSNCAHCHNPQGPADTSALDLSLANQSTESLGLCKPPIAAGRGSGGHLYGIVPGQPDASILVHRLASTDLRSRMPEVGRSLEHTEGVELVSTWIAALNGECR